MAALPSVCAVVITYHPDFTQLEKLVKITLPQVQSLLIVDNGSGDRELAPIRRWAQDDRMVGLLVVQLGKNCGVAAAQNRGMQWASEHSHSHVLLLDQDSLPSADMVSRLLSACTRLSQNCCIAAVGPAYRDMVTGNVASFVQNKFFQSWVMEQLNPADCIPADVLISSGSLIPLAVLEHVKPMDELLFIDNVDTEWCLRARSKGYLLFGVVDAILSHSLGEKTHKVWFGRWRHVPQHKPFRSYYIFRNSILLNKRAYIPFQWKIRNLIKLIYLFVFSMVWMSGRSERFIMIAHGIYDGMRGRTGKLA